MWKVDIAFDFSKTAEKYQKSLNVSHLAKRCHPPPLHVVTIARQNTNSALSVFTRRLRINSKSVAITNDESKVTKREYNERFATNPECGTCHSKKSYKIGS